ncbi:amino acid ABC transporter substrate-binding protein, PAAT family /amino acid ABC transporter membrane protein, PAAT family [[Clostridium] polysaccharolyticum]|uniref:Amino acid ABC transporter substrate-binding protein, PAAT family /amino acid ABC transporter membrane protein, PAAT family n=2 Tax=[Clostridium] polysaccharolyticum TaxID=29364 RepID=A0A1H9YHW5_9FIRM|nr:ABC transporter substrate-binding protein/permease [[Clostridium] polysaccharolyticum]SES68101.1 amino acid ABC transporter substrate-binding protein, PAAT family /amino acid ABC transporter membrane protein, PAAT family [[Clostridium] polysaccharolyticum]
MKEKLRKWAYLLICAAMLIGFAGCSSSSADKKNASAESIIVGTEAGFAPYEFMEGNQVVGIDMDIAEKIANKTGKKLVIKNMDFDGALVAVQQGKVDFVAAGVSVTEERKKNMDFSDNYVDSTDVVVVNADKPALQGVTELNDKVIGVQQGNVADLWVSNEDNVTAKEIKRYTAFAQAAQDLKNGKIDCIVMDEAPAKKLVKSVSGLKILEGEENIAFSDNYAIAVKKGNQELLTKINAVIKELKDNGGMDEIFAKYGSEEERSWISNIGGRFYDSLIKGGRYKTYLSGLLVTIEISFFAILLGILLGVLIAIGKVTANANSKFGWLGKLCGIYTTIIRGTPVIVQLLIIYNLIFTSKDANPILTGAVCFGINSSAYVAEIVRAGIESLDNGQTEAGRSLGFTYGQTMIYIILPQAVRNILPALGNEFISLIKETSVAGYIAVTDLTKAAQLVGNRTYDVLPPLIIAAAIYLVMVVGLTKGLSLIERRMGQGDRG